MASGTSNDAPGDRRPPAPVSAKPPKAHPPAATPLAARPVARPLTVDPAGQVAVPGTAPTARPLPTAAPLSGVGAARVAGNVAQPVALAVAPTVAGGAATPPLKPQVALRRREDEPKEKDEVSELAEAAARSAPPWLVSLLVHMSVLIALGLWVLLPPMVKHDVHLEAALEDPRPDHEKLGEQLEDETQTKIGDDIAPEEIIALSDLPEVDDPFSAPPNLEIAPDGMSATSDIAAPAIGNALDGRQKGSKEVLLKAYGGNGKSESAVTEGLKWLTKQQRGDGTWSLKGPYSDPGAFENITSATAMAMLAFQGAGHTHQSAGPYKKHVTRGLEALLKMQDEQGSFFERGEAPHNNRFYTQGQATIAVCEMLAMTKDPKLVEPAERAVRYLVENQDPAKGGWRYLPGQDSDLSVTGWIVMALQSARMAGLSVPPETLNKVNGFLDSVAKENGARYAYMAGGASTEVMTAEGLLCRQYLGWERDDERLANGVTFLVTPENLPTWKMRNVYYWYYATQVLHHMEGEAWKTWNDVMRDLLVEKQVKGGAEDGSWHPTQPEADRWGFQGGRLFTTCLSLYILEVYYRHLPIYSNKFGRPQ